MITAGDLDDRISEIDPMIDKYIEMELAPELIRGGIKSIRVPTKSVLQFYIDNGKHIGVNKVMSQFLMRGFHIKHECDDRPCGECWYLISIPPQKE